METYLKIHAEALTQIQIIEFVKQCTDIPVIHIANQRKCSVQEGMILKRMGVAFGVSDLFFPRGNEKYSGMWMELKAPKGKLSKNQDDFLCKMAKEGYYSCVCYSSANGIQVIKDFYSIE